MAAEDEEKLDSVARSAHVLKNAIEMNLKPRDIVTRKSIWNAVATVMATQGSTNAVLHFLAIAKAARVKWTLDDFEVVRRKVPVLCDLKPSGRYMAVDFHRVGGVRQVLRMLLDHGVLRGECMTVTGRTMAEGVIGSTIGTVERPRRDPSMVAANVSDGASQGPQG